MSKKSIYTTSLGTFLKHFFPAMLYIPSTINTTTLAHTIDCVCRKPWVMSWTIIITFKVFCVKKHFKLT